MMEIVRSLLIQLIMTVGIIVLAGVIIAACNKLFYRCVYTRGSPVVFLTGIVGTPVHELSHALMCLLFGHRITEMKLFQTDDSSGVLGYVNHSYNRKNVYQQAGNFFIGIAPIVVGSLVLFLLMYLLAPAVFVATRAAADAFIADTGVAAFGGYLLGVLGALFNVQNLGDPLWWVFIVLSTFIALHMTLSGADIKGGVQGFVYLLLVLIVVDVVLYFFGNALGIFTGGVIVVGAYLLSVLTLSLVMTLLLTLIALPIGLARRRL